LAAPKTTKQTQTIFTPTANNVVTTDPFHSQQIIKNEDWVLLPIHFSIKKTYNIKMDMAVKQDSA